MAVGMIKNRPKQKSNPKNTGIFQKSSKSSGKYAVSSCKRRSRGPRPPGNDAHNPYNARRGGQPSAQPSARRAHHSGRRNAPSTTGPTTTAATASRRITPCFLGSKRSRAARRNLMVRAPSCKILLRLVLRQRGQVIPAIPPGLPPRVVRGNSQQGPRTLAAPGVTKLREHLAQRAWEVVPQAVVAAWRV